MFTGFTPETIDFLWGIRMNNNREWFEAHKGQYVSTLYEPMKALGKDLFQPFLQRSGDLLKVSRIYRDTRMHPPVPYKETLWLCIRQSADHWSENPCLFFEISPDAIAYGFSFWRPKAASMEAFRRDVAANPKELPKILRKLEKDTGMTVSAACYKRPKAAPTEALQPYFNWKDSLGCIRSEPITEDVFGPELEQRVADFFRQLLPLYDYFNRFKGGAPL